MSQILRYEAGSDVPNVLMMDMERNEKVIAEIQQGIDAYWETVPAAIR